MYTSLSLAEFIAIAFAWIPAAVAREHADTEPADFRNSEELSQLAGIENSKTMVHGGIKNVHRTASGHQSEVAVLCALFWPGLRGF